MFAFRTHRHTVVRWIALFVLLLGNAPWPAAADPLNLTQASLTAAPLAASPGGPSASQPIAGNAWSWGRNN